MSRHDLVEQFQCGEENTNGITCPRRDGNKLPSLVVWLDFALQFLHQIIFYRSSHLPWWSIPGSSSTKLPHIRVEIGKPREDRMEIRLNGFWRETITGFFAKDGQRKMETITAVKD